MTYEDDAQHSGPVQPHELGDRVSNLEQFAVHAGNDLRDIKTSLANLTTNVDRLTSAVDGFTEHASRVDERLDRLTSTVEVVHGEVQRLAADQEQHRAETARILRRLELNDNT